MSESADGNGRRVAARPDANQLLEYGRILAERRTVVLAAVGLAVVVTMTLTFLATPIYRAVATLEIERRGPEILEFTDVVSVDPAGYKDFYQTQYMLLQSRTILRLAAEELDLPRRPEFTSRQATPLARAARFVRERLRGAPAEEDPFESAIEFIRDGLEVSPVRNSYLVQVSFKDRHPAFAAEVANGVAEAYQQFQLESRYDTTGKAHQFLTGDVLRVQDEIKDLEHKLQAYAVEKELVGLGDDAPELSEQSLTAINAQVVEAAGALAAAEARDLAVRDAPAQAIPEVLESPTIAHLRREFDALERRETKLTERFRPDWPPLIQVRDQMRTARRQLDREIATIADHVRAVARSDHERLAAELRSLERQREKHKREVRRVQTDAIHYASLQAEIDSKRDVLRGLIGRQNETGTSYRLKESSTSNIRVVDPAATPKRPVSPRKMVNLLLSLLVGLTGGIALAVALDYLDNTVKSEADLTRQGLTVLGHVPLIPLRLVESAEDGSQSRPSFSGDIASHTEPRSGFAEAFRNLRTALLLASPDRPPRNIAVTSCQPGDGKSTTALNLAIVLTQLGRRVLLVDADLRRARLHKALDVENEVGLSSFLSGNAQLTGLPRATAVPNLELITSGPLPPNPSELLGSPRLDELLRLEDGGLYDHVIFDSPPLLAVTDAMILSSRLDATVVVARSSVTRREALAQAVTMLEKARAPVVGSVLNAVSEESGYYYYGGRYRYGPYARTRSGYYSAETDDAPASGKQSRRHAG